MIAPFDPPDGPILGVDCSNYTTKRLSPYLEDLYAAGVRVFFPQAVAPPDPYPPTQTRAQIDDLLADGRFAIVPYVFWWAFAGLVFLNRQMATLSGYEGELNALAIDEEDTTIGLVSRIFNPQRSLALPGRHILRISRQHKPRMGFVRPIARIAGASASSLVDDISSWWTVLGQYPTTSNELIDYSGGWYYGPYLGNPTRFAEQGHRWWTSLYDGIPDTLAVTSWGGFSPPADAKQFIGTTSLAGLDAIDLSVIDPSFYAALVGHPNKPAVTYDDLASALGDVTGADGEIVTALQNATKLTTVKTMRPAIRAIVSRLGDIHTQFLSGGS